MLILLIGVLLDVMTTYIAFTRYGCLVERNPITRNICYISGHCIAVVVGGLLEFTILYLLFRLYELKASVLKEYFMGFVALLPYVAVINNVIFLATH